MLVYQFSLYHYQALGQFLAPCMNQLRGIEGPARDRAITTQFKQT
jgi:hypothetical protein